MTLIQEISIDATTGVASYAGGLKGVPIGLHYTLHNSDEIVIYNINWSVERTKAAKIRGFNLTEHVVCMNAGNNACARHVRQTKIDLEQLKKRGFFFFFFF